MHDSLFDVRRTLRMATVDEIGLAESICSLLYKAMKLREQGRSDIDHLREAGVLLKDWRSLPHAMAPTTERAEIGHDRDV